MKRMAFVVAILAACSSKTGAPNGDDDAVDANPNAPDANPLAPDANPLAPDANPNAPDAEPPGAKPIIFTILMENHDYNEIVSAKAGDAASMDAPYTNTLIAKYGLATNYKDTGHPSLPNYLHLISGNNQYPGIVDVDPTGNVYFPVPDSPPSGSTQTPGNLGDQMTTAGIKWRSYQEGPKAGTASTPCELSATGEYAPKHDPFLYFDNLQNRNGSQTFCQAQNVDYATNFATDLAADDYAYMWITPNLTDDGHDATTPQVGLQTSDTWLKNNLPAILASDGYKAGGIVFLTWDESEGRNGDDPDLIPMIIISPRLKKAPMTSATAYTHSSYTATIEDLFKLPRLSTVSTAPSMMEFFQ